MKRELVFAYDQRVPQALKALVPNALKARVAGTLFQATRHPDFAFRHIRLLREIGQLHKAVPLYADPNSTLAPEQLFEDPLMACDVNYNETLTGEFGYRGLLVSIDLSKVKDQIEINLTLDGVVIRREALRSKARKSRLAFLIGREAVAGFPTKAAVTITGDAQTPLCAPISVSVPHGTGTLFDAIKERGLLEKKGGLRPSKAALFDRQNKFLTLYEKVRLQMAKQDVPLLILYGTLLGQHRSRDFIPGDDDFDVGYPSNATTPEQVKEDAKALMSALVEHGFVVSMNAEGKPFRIAHPDTGPDVYLDNRPVFSQSQGHVWLHKHAKLPMDLDGFWHPVTDKLRETEVLKPAQSELFLESYYGKDWRVPDPGFSNASKSPSKDLLSTLAKICLSIAEQKALKSKLDQAGYPGKFDPMALAALYPVTEQP